MLTDQPIRIQIKQVLPGRFRTATRGFHHNHVNQVHRHRKFLLAAGQRQREQPIASASPLRRHFAEVPPLTSWSEAVAPGIKVLTFSAWGKDDGFRGSKSGEECSFDPTLTKGVARENDGPASVGPNAERSPDMSD